MAALIAAALAGCAGPRQRIKKHQAEFDSYTPEIQQKIRAGQVDVGFTDRQVALALGRPDRVYSRKTASADRIGLRQRAWPLVEMLKRCQAEGAVIVWGV